MGHIPVKTVKVADDTIVLNVVLSVGTQIYNIATKKLYVLTDINTDTQTLADLITEGKASEIGAGGGGGNPFDQDLNTTDDVFFNSTNYKELVGIPDLYNTSYAYPIGTNDLGNITLISYRYSPDGTIFIYLTHTYDLISLTLAIPFDISSVVSTITKNLSAVEAGYVTDDGLHFYHLWFQTSYNRHLRILTTTTPWDFTSYTTSSLKFDGSFSSGALWGSEDGLTAWCYDGGSYIVRYIMTTPFSPSSAGNPTSYSFSADKLVYLLGMAFSPDGTRLLIRSTTTESPTRYVFRTYELSTPFDLNTRTQIGDYDASGAAYGCSWFNDGSNFVGTEATSSPKPLITYSTGEAPVIPEVGVVYSYGLGDNMAVINNAGDIGTVIPEQEATTNGIINLTNSSGIYYNMDSVQDIPQVIVGRSVFGGKAIIRINQATEPVFSQGVREGIQTFLANTDLLVTIESYGSFYSISFKVLFS